MSQELYWGLIACAQDGTVGRMESLAKARIVSRRRENRVADIADPRSAKPCRLGAKSHDISSCLSASYLNKILHVVR